VSSLPIGPRDWDEAGVLTSINVRLKALEATWAHPRITQWCDRVLTQRNLPRLFSGWEQHYNLPYDALQQLHTHLNRVNSLEVAEHGS
jgi:hypothetical protein